MKHLALILFGLVALTSPAKALDAPDATPPTLSAVSKTYATLGDVIASTMNQLVPVMKANAGYTWRIDGPIIVTYDHTSAKLVVSAYGDPDPAVGASTGSVDRAKTALEYFRGKAFPMIAACIGQNYGVGLNDSDLTLVYFNRRTMKEVIRREGTKYLVSSE